MATGCNRVFQKPKDLQCNPFAFCPSGTFHDIFLDHAGLNVFHVPCTVIILFRHYKIKGLAGSSIIKMAGPGYK